MQNDNKSAQVWGPGNPTLFLRRENGAYATVTIPKEVYEEFKAHETSDGYIDSSKQAQALIEEFDPDYEPYDVIKLKVFRGRKFSVVVSDGYDVNVETKMSASQFVSALRTLPNFREMKFSASADQQLVRFGVRDREVSFARFASWFQRHTEETDLIAANFGNGRLLWEAPTAGGRDTNELYGGPTQGMKGAVVTISGLKVDLNEIESLMKVFARKSVLDHTTQILDWVDNTDLPEGRAFESPDLIGL